MPASPAAADRLEARLMAMELIIGILMSRSLDVSTDPGLEFGLLKRFSLDAARREGRMACDAGPSAVADSLEASVSRLFGIIESGLGLGLH